MKTAMICTCLLAACAIGGEIPDGFVDLGEEIPKIQIDLRYFSRDNFVGMRVDDYRESKCFLTRRAAHALGLVQQELSEFGLGLKVFDGYRPQGAVDHFVRWAKDLDDRKTKSKYYPNVEKRHLFRDGYIASRSGHSRGSTVDLTIVSLSDSEELDMGTSWDFFDPASWPDSREVTPTQRGHRLLLRTLMMKHGFKPLREEWWHFTLLDETFPNTYFDFPIQ